MAPLFAKLTMRMHAAIADLGSYGEPELAALGEPCGPATVDGRGCLDRAVPTASFAFVKCSSETDLDATCVECGFRNLPCCPEGLAPDVPPCREAPRVSIEIACNEEEDICDGEFPY